MKARLLFMFIATLLLASATAAFAAGNDELAMIRRGTAPYHRLDAAMEDGYVLLPDCMSKEGEGAMGVHYIHPDLLDDTDLDLSQPEALVYEPGSNGRMRLVAVEFVVFKDAWEAEHGTGAAPPVFLGQELELKTTIVSDGQLLPPLYELHTWVWRHNPNGVFGDWNPKVSCPAS